MRSGNRPVFQYFQAINLFLLVILGYYTAYLYLPLFEIILLVLFACVLEHLMIYIKKGALEYFSVSAMTTALGVVLMMVAVHWWIYLLVITAGLLQKHLLRFGSRHFFNPSNFALMTGLTLFYKDAHIVLGQLGDAWWLAVLTALLAIGVLWFAKRWIIPLFFVAAYLLLEYLWVLPADPVMRFEDLLLRFYSVSFLVFLFFMLTDPRTTPENDIGQMMFGIGVGVVAVVLDLFVGFRIEHLFLALFGVSAIYAAWMIYLDTPKALLRGIVLILLVAGAIIYIEIQPPYYFAMDG